MERRFDRRIGRGPAVALSPRPGETLEVAIVAPSELRPYTDEELDAIREILAYTANIDEVWGEDPQVVDIPAELAPGEATEEEILDRERVIDSLEEQQEILDEEPARTRNLPQEELDAAEHVRRLQRAP